jgi:CheY-like chemotaxis protein/two-component sensor histidine kinase
LRKLESVGRLAGGIAHDFNNLLTGIMGNIEIVLMRFKDRDTGIRENLNKALKASRRAADLTHKLLTFAKGGEPIKESTDIAEIIRDSAEFSLLGSPVALKLNLPKNLWAAEVDAGQISQVIQNLVINAVHAMPEGGLLTISGENVEVSLGQAVTLALKPGLYVKISIRDQGCGIPKDLQARIFDPFFTTKDEGSGLGLSVVHSIVNKHGGCVKVSSEPGNFTEFTLYLPALGQLPERLQSKSRTPKSVGSARRILIMDDEEIVREILYETLSSYGYEVTVVRDGREAVEEYKKKAFDLVITDLTVPGGLGGRETVKLLKECDPDVKVVVSSGYANNPVMAGYDKFGFCGCLDKPYIIEDLLRLITRILG